ncbi:MAG: hypothetical protein ACR2NA_13980 [Solirubrobacterales bacterium]
MTPPARRLHAPRPVGVDAGPGRAPRRVDGRTVEGVREQWLVEDRWWTEQPLRRHYFELVLDGGRITVVFCDLLTRRWYTQRA